MTDADVAVIGAGPAGLVAAIALAGAGLDTVLIGERRRHGDWRTTALLAGSVTALDTLGVWQRCRENAAPLRVMRVIDATRRLWRAPPVEFSASEIGLDQFGCNIENRHLLGALAEHAAGLPGLRWIEAVADEIALAPDHAAVNVTGGKAIHARLVVGADGRKSRARAAASIAFKRHQGTQTALVFNVEHTRPHENISTEFHTETGPFTLVPLPGRRSSVVCVVDAHDARRLTALDGAALDREIERRAFSILGKMHVTNTPAAFALGVETAQRLAQRR
ncbi:MAG: FAD-dependent monooxygenase, partial [Proteobacteria bacterium]|nr:FAD-dependent monooxygenase [Pseudomonadota bacterium]